MHTLMIPPSGSLVRGVTLCILLMLQTAWGQIRSFEFRTLITTREVAEMIRSEVDGGGAPEAFEKTYATLLSDGRVTQISRDLEEDAPYDRRINIIHHQPNLWESELWSNSMVLMPPFFMKSDRDVCFGHNLTPPRTGGISNNYSQFEMGSGGFTTLRDNHWQLLSQWMPGTISRGHGLCAVVI